MGHWLELKLKLVHSGIDARKVRRRRRGRISDKSSSVLYLYVEYPVVVEVEVEHRMSTPLSHKDICVIEAL